MSRLPTPPQWVLDELNDMELAELIEQHIDYVDAEGRSVHLPMQFVRHYMQRYDSPLPTVVAIATQPIVLADGGIVAAEDGIDLLRGIALRVPKEVMTIVPRRKDCKPKAVAKAMKFLTEQWLVDVKTDFVGKCVAIAIALTLIERSLLDQRPVFFVTAGQRGSGKTTLLTMLIIAVTGLWPAAAAWSPNTGSAARRSWHISWKDWPTFCGTISSAGRRSVARISNGLALRRFIQIVSSG